MITLPTLLTFIRIVGAIVLMPILLKRLLPRQEWHGNVLVAAIFALLAITDFFDGYLARLLGQESLLGKVLDPFADKLLVTVTLITLIALQRIPAWVGIIITSREFFVMTLRELALLQGFAVPVAWAGKIKTTLQLLYLGVVILNTADLAFLPKLRQTCESVLLTSSIFFTLYSAILYYQSYVLFFI
jgi:CDP-diacylglycerol--glycerol-3-phosphate 3-phosphatidyltransferase